MIDKVKIGALYNIIDSIEPYVYDLIFKFTGVVLTIGIVNPLPDEYITYTDGSDKIENPDFDKRYLKLHEDKTFKKYKIDLSKDFIIFDTIEITKKNLELILFTIDNL